MVAKIYHSSNLDETQTIWNKRGNFSHTTNAVIATSFKTKKLQSLYTFGTDIHYHASKTTNSCSCRLKTCRKWISSEFACFPFTQKECEYRKIINNFSFTFVTLRQTRIFQLNCCDKFNRAVRAESRWTNVKTNIKFLLFNHMHFMYVKKGAAFIIISHTLLKAFLVILWLSANLVCLQQIEFVFVHF